MRAILPYASLAAPIAFAGIPLYVFAPDFYATHHGISLTSLGIVLLVLRLIDAFQDPLIGRLSDTHTSKRGLLLGCSCVVLVAAFCAVFQPPQQATLLWFALSMLLATTAYSVLSIQINSLGGLWSDDAHTQTRIAAAREGFGLVGLLLAVLLPAWLLSKTSPSHAMLIVSGVLALLTFAAYLLFMRWYRPWQLIYAKAATTTEPLQRIWPMLRQAPRALKRFWLIYGISMLASSIPAVLIVFFVRDRLGAQEHLGLFLMLYFIAAAASMPLWSFISKHAGKEKAWLFTMLLAIGAFSRAFTLGTGDTTAFALICIASGIAFGGELALPPALLAGLMQRHNAQANAALLYSILTFLLKFSLALASLLAFALLDLSGLKPAAEGNSEAALWGLSLCYALLPCLIKAAAALVLYRSLPLFHQGESHETYSTTNRSATHAHKL